MCGNRSEVAVTTIRAVLSGALGPVVSERNLGAVDVTLEPATADETAACLQLASTRRWPVEVWGAGRHRGFGYPLSAKVALATGRMDRVLDVIPDDLIAVVEAGVPVGRLASVLDAYRLTAALPLDDPEATVGGVVAAGLSGWTRLRYGPTRDRVLEVTVATGDGRVIRGGGRVVKNVSGYDLPRLLTGSLGSLGVICQVALKLWPRGEETAMIRVGDGADAFRRVYRPLAVLETPAGAVVYSSGTRAELEALAAGLGGVLERAVWPRPPDGPVRLRLNITPSATTAAIREVAVDFDYVAAHGVGQLRLGGDPPPRSALALRSWARSSGGSLVVEAAPSDWVEEVDPWGPSPSWVELQRRVKAAFDPAGVVNSGILPGRV